MGRSSLALALVFVSMLAGADVRAQAQAPTRTGPEDIRELKLRDWEPRSMIVTKVTDRRQAGVSRHRRPQPPRRRRGDAHPRARSRATSTRWTPRASATVVNLDGGWGDRLKETLAALDQAHPGRFLTYALIDFEGIDDPGWTDREAKRLEAGLQGRGEGSEVPQDASA